MAEQSAPPGTTAGDTGEQLPPPAYDEQAITAPPAYNPETHPEVSKSTVPTQPAVKYVDQNGNPVKSVEIQQVQPIQPKQQIVYVQPAANQQPVTQQQMVYVDQTGHAIKPQQQQIVYIQQPQPADNALAPQYIYQQPNQPVMNMQTQQFDAALINKSSKTNIRATGRHTKIAPYSIARYNYVIECLQCSFKKNGLESEFKGKFIPIKTWYWDSYEDTNIHRSMWGRCFNCWDWCCVLIIIALIISALSVQTCSYSDLIVDTDTWDDDDCYSTWVDTDNMYGYNEYVRSWRKTSLMIFLACLVMVVVYGIFIRVVIINRRNQKELLTFAGKAGQYSFTCENEFFEVSRSEYLDIVGVTTNNSTTHMYGGKFELSNKSIHVMLYKRIWMKHFKTATFRIWFWFIVYIIVWCFSMKAINRWYSAETY